jgi:hypothetical protein
MESGPLPRRRESGYQPVMGHPLRRTTSPGVRPRRGYGPGMRGRAKILPSMNRHLLWPAAAVFVLLIGTPRPGAAQEIAGSFDQLRVLVKQGDRVRVTDASGREVVGRIADLGPSSLALLADGARRDFTEKEISTIRQRRSDSVANGALWGLGIGAAVGLLGGVAIASSEEDAVALIPIITAVYGGIGAGIGVGVDALISSEQVIYARRAGTSARIRLGPVLTSNRRGVALSVHF